MLCHEDLINISRRRKIVIIVFDMQLWQRFPVSEFNVEMDRFMVKQTFPPSNFHIKRDSDIKTNTFLVDIR
jgi:hypothetical protein